MSYKKGDFIIMNVELSQNQITVILELLKPYTELSVSLTNQCRAQLSGAVEIPHAKKAEETKETK